jgi:hypothetical protein
MSFKLAAVCMLCIIGYWPSDFYKVNPAFGSKDDLLDLLKAYQSNGRHNGLRCYGRRMRICSSISPLSPLSRFRQLPEQPIAAHLRC